MANESFEHFIITRFNVPLPWASRGWDDNWLKSRIRLFEDFCYRSVMGQSCQAFKWLVLFDQQSPEYLRDLVDKYSEYENFVPVYMSTFSQEELCNIIREHLDKLPEYLITTRLDNDDAIHKDFISVVQQHFDAQELLFLNFLKGYRWHEGKIYSKDLSSNMFLSLVEKIQKNENFKSVCCGNHTRINEVGTILDISGFPAWLMVIHDDNLLNKRVGIRKPLKRLTNNFCIAPEHLDRKENMFLCRISQAIGNAGRFYYTVKNKIFKS